MMGARRGIGGLWRSTVCGILLGVASLSPAVTIDYLPTLQGTVETAVFEGAGGTQELPVRAVYTTTVGSPGTGYSVLWECVRVRGYNKLTGALYAISPQGVYSISHGWFSGSKQIDLDGPFWVWFGGRTNPEERFGEFQLRLSYKPGPGSTTTVVVMSWIIRHQDDYKGGTGGGGGSGGGVGGNDDTVEGQNNFWSNLFVPGADCLDDLRGAAEDLANWGPFGWYSVVSGRIQDNSTGRIDVEPYTIPINIPGGAVGVEGTYVLDMRGSWTEAAIRFVRAVMAGILWYYFIFKIGKRIIEKV